MKRKPMTRAVLLVLCGILLLLAFAACGKKKPTTTDSSEQSTTAEQDTGPVIEYDANGYQKDSLDGKNYGGKEVNILSWKDPYSFPEDTVMKISGESLEKDIYSRDQEVQFRLNVDFNITRKTSNTSSSSNRTELYDAVRNAAMDGSSWDVVCSYSLYPPMLSVLGLCYDLNTLQYPETDKPWYPVYLSNWEVYDRLFFLCDNSSVRVLTSMSVLFSNADMITSVGLEDPVNLVLEKEWTLEKFEEYTTTLKSAYTGSVENGGSGKYTFSVEHTTRLDNWVYAAGFGETRATGDPTVPIELAYVEANDKLLISDWVTRMVNILDDDACLIYDKDSCQTMIDGVTAFHSGSLSTLLNHGGDIKGYSVLPLPMLNEEQGEYHTTQNNGFDVWCIPSCATDPELGGVIIEAIASSDYRTIGPKVYDTILKARYSTSELGAQMFDIIRSSLWVDFGRIHHYVKGSEGQYQSMAGTLEESIRVCFRGADNTPMVYNASNFVTSVDANATTRKAWLMDILLTYRNFNNQQAQAAS